MSNDSPDQFSNAWYRKQFRGQTFLLNQIAEEYVSAADLIESLTARVVSLETAMEDDRAEIGQLREELETSMEKVRLAYKDLKNGS